MSAGSSHAEYRPADQPAPFSDRLFEATARGRAKEARISADVGGGDVALSRGLRGANAVLLAITILSGWMVTEAALVLGRLAWRAWQAPVLFGDSAGLILPADIRGAGLLRWLFSQHNEHRIVVQRLSSLLGEAALQIPPGAGGVPSNVLLLLAIAGTLAWICSQLIRPRLTALACWLVTTLLAWHPWQWENILWEFQTPWFLISLLVLLSTAIQLQVVRNGAPTLCSQLFVVAAPLVAIFSSLQGLVAAGTLTLAAFVAHRRSGWLALASTLLGAGIFFGLGMKDPGGHPALGFHGRFFLVLLSSPLSRGKGPLLLGFLGLIAVLVARRLLRSNWGELLILAQPILFAVAFAMMVTIGRSGMGIDQAYVSRYTSYSVLIPIGLLLIIVGHVSDRSWLNVVVLMMCVLLILAPGADRRWQRAYEKILTRYSERVGLMRCAITTKGIDCLKQGLWPNDAPHPIFKEYLRGHDST